MVQGVVSMNFNIYKSFISDAITEVSKNKCYGETTVRALNQIGDSVSRDVPIIVFNETLTNATLQNVVIPVEDSTDISQITRLYDKTFIINTPNKQIAHYDENFNLIQYLPITDPLLHGEVKVVEKFMDNLDNETSLIFISYPTEHVIRIYKYKYKSVIELVGSIGTSGTAGVSANLLTSPLHFAILQTADCLKLFVFNNDTTKVIKEFSIIYTTVTPTINDLGIISTDTSNLLTLSNQDLVSVTCMDIFENKLFISSVTNSAWGVYNLESLNSTSPSTLNIIFSKNSILQKLDYEDSLTFPVSFYYSTSLQRLIITDTKGHIILLNALTFKVVDYFGIPSDPTTYHPNHFTQASSIYNVDSDLFFIDRSKLIKSNFLKLNYSLDSVDVISPSTDTMLKDIIGLDDRLLDINSDQNLITKNNYKNAVVPANTTLTFYLTQQPSKFVVIFSII